MNLQIMGSDVGSAIILIGLDGIWVISRVNASGHASDQRSSSKTLRNLFFIVGFLIPLRAGFGTRPTYLKPRTIRPFCYVPGIGRDRANV